MSQDKYTIFKIMKLTIILHMIYLYMKQTGKYIHICPRYGQSWQSCKGNLFFRWHLTSKYSRGVTSLKNFFFLKEDYKSFRYARDILNTAVRTISGETFRSKIVGNMAEFLAYTTTSLCILISLTSILIVLLWSMAISMNYSVSILVFIFIFGLNMIIVSRYNSYQYCPKYQYVMPIIICWPENND